MKISRIAVTTLCFLLAFSGLGCAQNDSLQKKYGADASYFIALNALKENDLNHATRCLKDAAKKGSPLIARRAMEKLAETGSLADRGEHSRNLYKKFPDEESLTVYTKELYLQKEYYAVISKTEKLDYSQCSNELAYYRMISLLRKNDSRLKKEYYSWLIERPYSTWHEKFHGEYIKVETSSNPLAEFRYLVFKKDFVSATEKINSVHEIKSNRKPMVFSDTGKALLYGTKDFASAAEFMDSLYQNCSGDCRYYCDFYAGRFYDKNGNTQKALQRFFSALEKAEDDLQYDNTLWYILNTKLKCSLEETYDCIEEFSPSFRDREYYDDFFNTLSVRLITSHKWELYRKTARLIYGKAGSDSVAKFSYITARLIQTGYLKSEKDGEATQMLRRAMEEETSLYYKILAMEKLGLDEREISSELMKIGVRKKIEINPEAEKLLSGYADFGLAEYIYSEYEKQKNHVSTQCAQKMAQFLKQCGSDDETYLKQSVRIASRRVFSNETDIDRELYALAFPQNFNEIISRTCSLFSQSEYLLYALIRSESFFDPKVVSHAGAVGLTQLMNSTAGDIAKKLKLSEYDLMDTETNITFGSFYLAELIRRLDGSIILAAFSYNGGISRVRSWVKSAAIEFGAKKVPADLFLEALPYEETREYGRKIVSAAGIYGWLYYGKSTSEVAKEILD